MKEVAVIADSVGCIPRDIVEALDIEVIAPNIYSNGSVFRDWLDITPGQAYELLRKDPDAFSTAAPSLGELADVYRKAARKARNLLYVAVSSRVSTLHDAAVSARAMVREELPGTAIEVMDSGTCTGAEGFVAVAAARVAAAGGGLSQVAAAAAEVKARAELIFVLDTIRYAYRTGRIPKAASRLGSALDVKPILTWCEGTARLKGLTRSRKRAAERLLGFMRDRVGRRAVHVAVHHAARLAEAEELRGRVMREFNCLEVWLTEFSPVMGYSAGPGALGLAFYPDK